ncbi:MAG TPA: peptidase M64 N-terminal domain-containing protein, partial [Bacteroidales bacterium]|nr:peptidase M64 N-terminal domain-containing protein [Bacteroidales bacterium]
MKTLMILLLSVLSVAGSAQINFNNFFYDKVLRFDFMFAGNKEETHVYPVGFKVEPYWAGSVTDLSNPFDYGNFKYELFDDSTNTLLYSKGFCTLFQEWQTTDEAKTTDRSYYEV